MRGVRTTELLLIFICGFAIPSHAAPLELKEWRGQVVYLDFWASWCAPCRQSFPWMQLIQTTYGSRGLTVVAINVDRSRADADKFLARFNPDFEIRFDPQGALAQQFNVSGMPTSVMFDRHGVVRFTHVGFLPADEKRYIEEIRSLLAER